MSVIAKRNGPSTSRLLKKSLAIGNRRCDSVFRRIRGGERCEARTSGPGSLFSYVDLEARVGRSHPLRAIRAIVNEALAALAGDFSALYSPMGRPSIPPEKLLRAMLLQAFYSIRSERQLMERLEFDLLFRWFVGLGIDDAVWDHSAFSKNRDRLLEGDIAAKFLSAVLAQPRVKRLLEHGAFLGRRHADRGVGVDEELQADRMGRTNRRRTGADATRRRTFTARSARTRRTPRRPIPRRGSIAKGRARRPSSASWAMP